MTQDASHSHPYSKVLAISSSVFAVVGAIAGIGVLVLMFSDAETRKDVKAALISPFVLGGAGYVLGMSLAFLFAPSSFIVSESGKKWMDKVGTKSVATARIVCATVAIIASAFFGIMIWAALTGTF
jgi:hypothetical protein